MSDKHEQLTSGGESRTEAGSADWQRYLDAELGLRNHWYPAFFSRDLADGETRHESLLGERIYFKRVAGRVYAVENRCAHRGAPFSSRVECYTDETITCPVHGFTYDVRDGKLVKILSIDDSPLIGRVAVPSYPIEERFSIVWIYIGDGEPRSLREDVLPSLRNTPELATRPTARARVRANWRIAIENGFDHGHLYGHRNWAAAERYGAVTPIGSVHKSRSEIVSVETPAEPVGMLVQSSGMTWVNEIGGVQVHSRLVDPHNPPPPEATLYPVGFGPFLPCGLDVPSFPRPGYFHWEWYVPIDEEHHMYTIMHGASAPTDADKEAFYREHAETLARDTWTDPDSHSPDEPPGFNNFDSFGREVFQHVYQYEDFWHREQLYEPDYAIIQWRKLVARHADPVQTRAARNFARPMRDYPRDPIP